MNAYDYNRAAADFRPALVTRVLVADDSAEFLAAASEVIAATEGFALDGIANSGEEAVKLSGLRPPDLALIDLNMPGIGGEEAAARIAAACPETAIVLMTSEPDRSTKSAAVFDKSRLSPKTLAEIGSRQGARRFEYHLAGTRPSIEATATHQQLAMLRILYGACATALDAFRAADNPVDEQLVTDLEIMVDRTHGEIERLTTHFADAPS